MRSVGLYAGLLAAAAIVFSFDASSKRVGELPLADPSGDELLRSRHISLPLSGLGYAALRDSFLDGRPGHRHEAIDIAAPRGASVYAVDDGTLAKLYRSIPGGMTVYQLDPNGRLAYYYAHLDAYAIGLREGMPIRRCQLLGFVGTSGNAPVNAPHLHFAVFQLGPDHHWWQGTAINPYVQLRDAALPRPKSEAPSSAARTERRPCPP